MTADQSADRARTEIAKASEGVAVRTGKTLKDLLAEQQASISRALPKTIDGERYVRIVQTQLSANRDLMECTPQSFLGAVLTSAQLGLEFGPTGQAYMIPFKNRGVKEIQLVIGYKGWIALGARSGYIASVNAHVVHEKDEFDYAYGLNERCNHVPWDLDDPGPATHYYCIIRTTAGGAVFRVMTRRQIEKHRDRFAKQFKATGKGPWADDFDAMAIKTVYLQTKNLLPTSAEESLASQVDGRVVQRNAMDDEPRVSAEDPEFDDEDVVDAEVVDTRSDADREDDEWRNA